ncbi:MAG: hypothetical protein J5728_01570, partial [Lachnospiraceae bacterium]|nr:hypothetical protein [Lachnospiraceae bacterium]
MKKGLLNLLLGLLLTLLVVVGCFFFYHTVYKGLKTAKMIADETIENAGSAAAIANREPLVVDAGDKSDFDKKMDTILQYMDYYYNGEIDMDAMYDAMLHAAVSSLGDPYSVYYSPEEYSALLESSSGVYSGIGATISQDMT